MEKNKITRKIVLIITFLLIVCMFTTVFAIDDIPSLDDDFNFLNTSTGGNSIGNNIENNIGNSSTGNSTGNNIGNNTGNNIENNNSSSYQNSEIPYAGVETSILMFSAFIVCGIIGIYTFMKLSDYSNI